MINKLVTVVKNTFTETIRQPVYCVIIVAALFLFVLSPAITMYTIEDDNKLLREIGLSTLFLTGLFIAIFSASGAVNEEIENKTITTVLSKPISRPVFVIGKFLGVSLAVILAHYICTIAILFVTRHGVMESAAQTHDWTVLTVAGVAIIGTIALTALFNFSYGWRASSTGILLLAIFSTLGVGILAFVDRHWQFNPARNGFNSLDIYGSVLLLFAVMIIVALAVALSTRFNIVVTLSCCIGIFLLGLVSDYVFGRFAETYLWAKIGRFLVPNLQMFWVSDAIYEGSSIPVKYIGMASTYAISYTTAVLMLAIASFQRRQVG